jgi:succinate-acetate transporter protein
MSDAFTHDRTGNPAPLGLVGFGMTTILFNFHNLGLFPQDSMLLSMGIFYGGVAQVVAGIMEWRKGNTFGATAFTSFGLFWLSLIALTVLPDAGIGAAAPSGLAIPLYLAIWGLFAAVLFIGTFRLNRALQVVFGTATLLFALSAIGEAESSAAIGRFAGWVGLLCGATGIYAGLAQVLNEI